MYSIDITTHPEKSPLWTDVKLAHANQVGYLLFQLTDMTAEQRSIFMTDLEATGKAQHEVDPSAPADKDDLNFYAKKVQDA